MPVLHREGDPGRADQEKADGTVPTQTEVFDYKSIGIVFEVAGYGKSKDG